MSRSGPLGDERRGTRAPGLRRARADRPRATGRARRSGHEPADRIRQYPREDTSLGYRLCPAAAGRRIALIAHDNKKQDMLEWAEYNLPLLGHHQLFATATTGRLLQDQLGLPVTCFRSGPFGGDQQIGARIAEGEIDLLVFFWDPLEPHPHDPDVKALLRVAVVCNIPVACNRATADFMISSPLMGRTHQHWDPVIRREPARAALAGRGQRGRRSGRERPPADEPLPDVARIASQARLAASPRSRRRSAHGGGRRARCAARTPRSCARRPSAGRRWCPGAACRNVSSRDRPAATARASSHSRVKAAKSASAPSGLGQIEVPVRVLVAAVQVAEPGLARETHPEPGPLHLGHVPDQPEQRQ